MFEPVPIQFPPYMTTLPAILPGLLSVTTPLSVGANEPGAVAGRVMTELLRLISHVERTVMLATTLGAVTVVVVAEEKPESAKAEMTTINANAAILKLTRISDINDRVLLVIQSILFTTYCWTFNIHLFMVWKDIKRI